LVCRIERWLGDLAVVLKRPNDWSVFEPTSFEMPELT
jgi:hypothetical protein